jgi:hypothetical protein
MQAVAPQTTTTILSARARCPFAPARSPLGLLELNQRLIEHLGSQVQSGPFRGMALWS